MKKEIHEIMGAHINKRMESDEWNYEIAESVFSKRKRNKRITIITTSITSFAIVASIFMTFILNSNVSSKGDMIGQFVYLQIEGTYREVFEENYNKGSSMNIVDETISYDSIDDLIDNALSMRK